MAHSKAWLNVRFARHPPTTTEFSALISRVSLLPKPLVFGKCIGANKRRTLALSPVESAYTQDSASRVLGSRLAGFSSLGTDVLRVGDRMPVAALSTAFTIFAACGDGPRADLCSDLSTDGFLFLVHQSNQVPRLMQVLQFLPPGTFRP